MRPVRYAAILAGAGLLVAGCGTKIAPSTISMAAAHTSRQSARVAVVVTIRQPGMSISFTESGEFDFARSVGVLRGHGRIGLASEERFIPPRIYVKIPDGIHGMLPRGKSWLAIDVPGFGGAGLASGMLGPFGGNGDPADLLSALTAISSSVKKLGSATIRGVPTTHYRLSVDPAKAAARVPAWRRPALRALARSTIPVDVWVDDQDLVRQVRVSLRPPGGLPAGGRVQFTETVDFFDFGVAVRVSAPPAAEVASLAQFAHAQFGRSVGTALRPPPVSGTLTAAQAAAAEQAARAFWLALGSHHVRAAVRAVLPSQRGCVRGMLGAFRFSVRSLRIVSAEPAGTGKATVRYTARIAARIGGHAVGAGPFGQGPVRWMLAVQTSGRWYVEPGQLLCG